MNFKVHFAARVWLRNRRPELNCAGKDFPLTCEFSAKVIEPREMTKP